MALINCPECNNSVSDRAKICIHCGFPLDEYASSTKQKRDVCKIDGIEYDMSDLKDYVLSKQRREEVSIFNKSQELIRLIPGFSILAAANLMLEIEKTGNVPATFNAEQYAIKFKEDDGLIHCPRCDSTNVSTGARGYNMMWGFIGSGKTVNRCGKCGYKWEPRK